MKVVALGGGHGLYASLSALRTLTTDLTAIVTVADDGGSSGRIRQQMDVLPPGDLRMALAALCEDTEWGRTWRDVLQYRFDTTGDLDGHAVGNVLITALWQHTGDMVDGLDWVARLLRAQGRVLPLANEPLDISALVSADGEEAWVHGQVAVATAPGRIVRVALSPADPDVAMATLDAIGEADVVVLGPGSWYSSVIPHFLVPGVRDALVAAQSRTVLTMNIAHQDEETAGTTRLDDVMALLDVVPEFRPAVVVLDQSHSDDDGLVEFLHSRGAHVHVSNVKHADALDRHDPALLAHAYGVSARYLSGASPLSSK